MVGWLEREPGEGCLSDLRLDQWRLGELAEAEGATCEAHCRRCAACSARRAALEAREHDFLERFGGLQGAPRPAPGPGGPARERRPERPASGAAPRGPLAHRLGAAASAGLAAAALALLWLAAPGGSPRPPREPAPAQPPIAAAPGATTRAKGAGRLGFFIRRGHGILPGAAGAVVHPGDRVRFTVRAERALQLALFSLDARGVASVYHPRADHSQRVRPSAEHALDSSVVLDAALGPERIWGVFCPEEFALEPLRAALEKDRRIEPPEGCSVETLDWVKRVAP